jgi:hypothetical protein
MVYALIQAYTYLHVFLYINVINAFCWQTLHKASITFTSHFKNMWWNIAPGVFNQYLEMY